MCFASNEKANRIKYESLKKKVKTIQFNHMSLKVLKGHVL